MTTTPIILFSDAPSAFSGLARITRDLALGIHKEMKGEFRVATLGHGSPGSSHLSFPQYHWNQRDDFLPLELPYIWRDFVGDDNGILMTIGDIQRFLPLADTTFSPDRNFAQWLPPLRKEGKLKLWGYFPIDAHGRDGKLGPQLGHTLSHYDRRLVPSEWAKRIVERTIPGIEVTAIPHGIDTGVFHPYPRKESQDKIGELLFPALQWPKEAMEVAEDALWIGIVATNQPRKDFGLGIEVVAELSKTRPVFLWIHTDRLKQEWSILELLSDFNLLQSSMVSVGNLSDATMAVGYSAMDLTLGIGRGEGFSFTNFESLACGTPCYAYDYGGHTSYMEADYLIVPASERIEGPLNLLRPIGDVSFWRNVIEKEKSELASFPPELEWKNLWPRFEKWLREGIHA